MLATMDAPRCEVELLQPRTLQIAHLTISPYRYEEKTRIGGALQITARVQLPLPQFEEFARMGPEQDLPVVRQGVDGTPRQMRLGLAPWSQHGDVVKYEVNLIDRTYFSAQAMGPQAMGQRDMSWQFANLRLHLAFMSEEQDALLDLLVNKGVVTAEERSDLVSRG